MGSLPVDVDHLTVYLHPLYYSSLLESALDIHFAPIPNIKKPFSVWSISLTLCQYHSEQVQPV